MENDNFWIVGIILMACGQDKMWQILGVILTIFWIILSWKK
jgi:hypothetical protein